MLLAVRLRVYLIADFSTRAESLVLRATGIALDAGVTAVQYRDKSGASARRKAHRALEVGRRVRERGALYIVNDNVQLALDVGADGVHLGPHDTPPAQARRLGGPGLVIGGSAGTPERAQRLEAEGVDYLGVGAVFEARSTKGDASAPRGPEGLRAVREAVGLPIVAIGGIHPGNAPIALSAGADGVAVVRAVLDADDPATVVHRLLAAWRAAPLDEGGGST